MLRNASVRFYSTSIILVAHSSELQPVFVLTYSHDVKFSLKTYAQLEYCGCGTLHAYPRFVWQPLTRLKVSIVSSLPSFTFFVSSHIHVLCILAYNFLDPQIQHAKVAAYVFGIAIAEVIIFVVVHFLIRLRVRLTRRRSTASSSQEAIDEWEEVDRPNDHTA